MTTYDFVADTNILLRFAHRPDPKHELLLSSIRKLKASDNKIHILPQTCVEFWNAFTRPVVQNGFGITIQRTQRTLHLIERIFPLLPDNARVHEKWRELVFDFDVSGKQVHDARIVAAMLVHQLTHILTFNTSDFARYSSIGIIAVDPKTV